MKTILSFILVQFVTIADGTIKEKLISSKMTEEEQERLQIIKLSDDDIFFERTDSKKVSEYL